MIQNLSVSNISLYIISIESKQYSTYVYLYLHLIPYLLWIQITNYSDEWCVMNYE